MRTLLIHSVEVYDDENCSVFTKHAYMVLQHSLQEHIWGTTWLFYSPKSYCEYISCIKCSINIHKKKNVWDTLYKNINALLRHLLLWLQTLRTQTCTSWPASYELLWHGLVCPVVLVCMFYNKIYSITAKPEETQLKTWNAWLCVFQVVFVTFVFLKKAY